jgi:hypothetical protein
VAEGQAQQAREASLVKFIESLKGNKGFEASRNQIRVVPKGLFVSESAIESVAETFQRWMLQESQGIADKSIEKTKQWLFDGSTPERLYLVEGKSVLTGFLITVTISAPQRSRPSSRRGEGR